MGEGEGSLKVSGHKYCRLGLKSLSLGHLLFPVLKAGLTFHFAAGPHFSSLLATVMNARRGERGRAIYRTQREGLEGTNPLGRDTRSSC